MKFFKVAYLVGFAACITFAVVAPGATRQGFLD